MGSLSIIVVLSGLWLAQSISHAAKPPVVPGMATSPAATAPSAVVPTDHQVALQRALDLAEQAKYKPGISIAGRLELMSQSLVEFDRAIRNEPTAEARIEQAELLLAFGRSKDAAIILERVIEQYPQNAEAYSLRGEAQRQLGDLAGAEKDGRKAVSLDRAQPLIAANFAFILYVQHKNADLPGFMRRSCARLTTRETGKMFMRGTMRS